MIEEVGNFVTEEVKVETEQCRQVHWRRDFQVGFHDRESRKFCDGGSKSRSRAMQTIGEEIARWFFLTEEVVNFVTEEVRVETEQSVQCRQVHWGRDCQVGF